MPKGLYRGVAESGEEFAFVDYGDPSDAAEIPRFLYEGNGYQPSFESLPIRKPPVFRRIRREVFDSRWIATYDG